METVSLSLQNLKRAKDLSSLAEVLGVQPTTLSFLLYKLPTEHRYRRFTIPKANGGVREICAPEPRLKFVQSQLSNLLLEIEQQLESVRKRECILAHGFKKNLSIVSNAKNHRNRRFVFNVDLKDFFPSINFGRVRGFFIKNRDFQLEPSVATVIAQIACHENMLPQGSPSSPIIANFVANILDIHLNRLARKHHCTYTRYADDLTFSTNKKAFPTAIARLTTSSFNGWEAGDELASRVSRAGFSLNPTKTRMQYKDSRQQTTGIIVNTKINVSVDYAKLTRSMCHHLFMDGVPYLIENDVIKPIKRPRLRGMLGHMVILPANKGLQK